MLALALAALGAGAWGATEPGFALEVAAAGLPGTTVYLALILELPEGWAIQAHEPTLEYLLPTVLFLEAAEDVEVAEVRYPPPQEKYLGFARRTLKVYTGPVILAVALRIADGARPGPRLLRGWLQFQPCTDAYCLFPEEREVFLRLWVLPRGP